MLGFIFGFLVGTFVTFLVIIHSSKMLRLVLSYIFENEHTKNYYERAKLIAKKEEMILSMIKKDDEFEDFDNIVDVRKSKYVKKKVKK